MRGRFIKGLAALVAAGALTFATAIPAEAATISKSINCSAVGKKAGVRATNYLSQYSVNVYAYNASTGAYIGSMTVLAGTQKYYITNVPYGRFTVEGNGGAQLYVNCF